MTDRQTDRRLVHRLHPLLLSILEKQDLPDIEFINENPLQQSDINAIYAANHQCKNDVPILALSLSKHAWIFAGKQRLTIADRLFFNMNGTIWADRKSRVERNKAKRRMIKLLNIGENVLIFPEGTWNFLPARPLLPLNWGCVDVAIQTNVPIVPVVKIKDNERMVFALKMVYVFSDKFITIHDASKIKEVLTMTKVDQLYAEEKREAVEKAIDDNSSRIATNIMLRRGEDKELVAKDTELSMDIIDKLLESIQAEKR